MRVLPAIRAARRAPLVQVAKSAVATLAAWGLSLLVIPDGPPPVFAAIAALLVVQPSVSQSMTKAIERSTGVLVGVVIASALGLAFGSATWVLMLAIAVALLAAWALKMTPGTTNQVGISALLVLALGAATPDYAVARVVETLVGAAIGFVVNLAIVPPVAVGPAHRALDGVGKELAATLERLADALASPVEPARREELLLTARLLRPMRDQAETAIEDARDSLALNPRGRRHRRELDEVERVLETLSPVVTQVIGMSRAFYDRYDDAISAEPVFADIAEQLRRAAHDVRLTLRRTPTAAAAAPETTTVPALTRPLRVVTPSDANWILAGALLEDLRRIHEELTGDA
ncbi:FUSC family protein [Microbacterium excoecariae]|uniref:FUSC family protein n=1 Tax=Microbacterium excoecariae TaxID=2715210 RepID=UPI0014078C23|nr:FUSC family protein [Microbacterium excoecariae]NHI16987.1 FUSC family protein [Microbacterium excoecariae]